MLMSGHGALPTRAKLQLRRLQDWDVPNVLHPVLLDRDLVDLIARIADSNRLPARQIALLLAQTLRHFERRHGGHLTLPHERIEAVFDFARERGYNLDIIPALLEFAVDHPFQPFDRAIADLHSVPMSDSEIMSLVSRLRAIYRRNRRTRSVHAERDWILSRLRPQVIGFVSLAYVRAMIERDSPQRQIGE